MCRLTSRDEARVFCRIARRSSCDESKFGADQFYRAHGHHEVAFPEESHAQASGQFFHDQLADTTIRQQVPRAILAPQAGAPNIQVFGCLRFMAEP